MCVCVYYCVCVHRDQCVCDHISPYFFYFFLSSRLLGPPSGPRPPLDVRPEERTHGGSGARCVAAGTARHGARRLQTAGRTDSTTFVCTYLPRACLIRAREWFLTRPPWWKRQGPEGFSRSASAASHVSAAESVASSDSKTSIGSKRCCAHSHAYGSALQEHAAALALLCANMRPRTCGAWRVIGGRCMGDGSPRSSPRRRPRAHLHSA